MLKFGDRVTITHKLYKAYNPETMARRLYSMPISLKKDCIYLGKRTLYNGIVDSDENYVRRLVHRKPVTACLICVNSKTNPIYVLEENVILQNC